MERFRCHFCLNKGKGMALEMLQVIRTMDNQQLQLGTWKEARWFTLLEARWFTLLEAR